jgi:hypothetical protein
MQIAGPFVMTGKLIFQEAQQCCKDWTSPVPAGTLVQWRNWLQQLAEVAKLSIPRWFGIPMDLPTRIEVFSDASNKGYGAVAYFVGPDGRTAFVCAKSRVINQNKPPTTPRGELQGLVIGTRMARTIIEELSSCLNFVKLRFWVDSIVVFYWIQADRKKFLPFVGNRLGEIHDTFQDLENLEPNVHWVDTKSNPADLISRGTDAPEFAAQFQFWTEGPEFLRQEETSWPKQPPAPSTKIDPEMKKEFAAVFAVTVGEDVFKSFNSVRDYYLSTTGKTDAPVADVEAAELELVMQAQREEFNKEFKTIRKLPAVPAGRL